MTAIRLNQFGGMVPRITNQRKLASFSASRAQDVDLTSGALSPILVDPPFQTMHDQTTGELKNGLDWLDLVKINKPDQVYALNTAVDKIRMCRPDKWAQIFIYVYKTWIDTATNEQKYEQVEFNGGAVWGIDYTSDGFILYQRGRKITTSLTAGVAYTMWGPIVQFVLPPDLKYNGGPDPDGTTLSYPSDIDWSTPSVTRFSQPLFYPVSMAGYETDGQTDVPSAQIPRYIYGNMELIDYSIPAIEQQISSEVDVASYSLTNGSYIASFRFRCNYVRDSQQFAYYIQSQVDRSVNYGYYDLSESTSGIVALKEPLAQPDTPPLYGGLRYQDGTFLGFYSGYAFDPGSQLHKFTLVTPHATFLEDDIVEVVDTVHDAAVGSFVSASGTDPIVVTVAAALDVDNAISNTGILLTTAQARIGYYSSHTLSGGNHAFTMATYETAATPTIIIVPSYNNNVGREGPPSDVSELVVVDPGEVVKLQVATPDDAGLSIRLYRSTTGAQDSFALLADSAESGEDAVFFDDFLRPLGDGLPKTGNYPHDTKSAALVNSLLHPNQFGIVWYANRLLFSDTYRFWAYPEDQTITLKQQIKAGAITGNSAIIFCEGDTEEGKIYEITGSDPRNISVYELSNAHPLLNKVGLAKIGQTIYWPTYDGIASTAGGEVRVPTEIFFTREEWNDQQPALMSCYSAENSLFIITAGEKNWRMDFDEMDKAPFIFLTTFTAFSKKEFIWESKIFQFPQPVTWSHVRVRAVEYPVAIEMYDGNDQQQAAMMVDSDAVRHLPRMRRSHEWKIRVHGYVEVLEVGVATSMQELL